MPRGGYPFFYPREDHSLLIQLFGELYSIIDLLRGRPSLFDISERACDSYIPRVCSVKMDFLFCFETDPFATVVALVTH